MFFQISLLIKLTTAKIDISRIALMCKYGTQ